MLAAKNELIGDIMSVVMEFGGIWKGARWKSVLWLYEIMLMEFDGGIVTHGIQKVCTTPLIL